MSQHTSLKLRGFGVRHRNVLKRYERLKRLKVDDRWKEDMSVFGLPKVKSLKVKIKKVKAEAKAEAPAAGTAGAVGTPAPAPAPGGKAPGAKAETKPKAGK